jgi:hypothetical protein
MSEMCNAPAKPMWLDGACDYIDRTGTLHSNDAMRPPCQLPKGHDGKHKCMWISGSSVPGLRFVNEYEWPND